MSSNKLRHPMQQCRGVEEEKLENSKSDQSEEDFRELRNAFLFFVSSPR